ncbi:asparaginase [Streptomyces sp. H10-C2]|uniref:asparaginase n=1 Tax=unclassified Streptomyces TaxID=2593676 RepID=UPI0024BAB6D5|nr:MULTISPECIES: asparaginase [unclassified Streptomyces]MDJ0347579.1 asparaginase [Streptomyces sp. PH10-H1]MDJ0375761.1 asparaginase [Streptomyces sp. H10-C2]
MSVALFTLGGTISMAGAAEGGGASGVVSRLTGGDLTAAVPGLADLGVPLDVRDVQAVPSSNLTFPQMLDLVEAASRAVADGAVGVVVTQGTDTLEETAFLVDLIWRHPEPFVLTGAMRNPTLAGPDGPANLLAAAQIAASPPARGLGALVAFNDEIHAARWVRKTHSTSTATFASPNLGPIGQVIEGQVRILVRPPRPEPLPNRNGTALLGGTALLDATALLDVARVGLYTVVLDDDGVLLDGLDRTHQGLVVAGFGVGHVPSALAPVLGSLADRIPVVLTSRTGAGSVLRKTYSAVGSESDLQRRGLINGGLLDPYKARILLRLLLAAGADRDDIAAAFARHG